MGLVYANAYLVFVAMGPSLALEKELVRKIDMPAVKGLVQKGTANCSVLVRRAVEHNNFINSADEDASL